MDPEAARRARQKLIKRDLAEAYTDDEAVPPEWVDLIAAIVDETEELKAKAEDETLSFIAEPDIRKALRRRENADAQLRERVMNLNAKVRRLNLIAPSTRFTRAPLDVEELLRPLFRTKRFIESDASSDGPPRA